MSWLRSKQDGKLFAVSVLAVTAVDNMPGIKTPIDWLYYLLLEDILPGTSSTVTDSDVVDVLWKTICDIDEPPCIALSGGLDSSILAKIAFEIHGSIPAVTIAATETHPDVVHARIASAGQHLHQVHLFEPTSEDKYNILFGAVAKTGCKTVICGDTADELFGGYACHQYSNGDRAKVFQESWDMLYQRHLEPMHRYAIAHGIDVVLPYLCLVPLMPGIPFEERATDTDRKIMLKKIARRVGVPDCIINREKVGLCHAGLTSVLPHAKP